MGPLARALAAAATRGGQGLARKKSPWLHPKHGPIGYYKGVGARRLGRHTRKGGYVLDWERRVPTYQMPAAAAPTGAGGELLPYVSVRTPLVTMPPPPGTAG